MSDQRPDHEAIEKAFRPAHEMLARLPDTSAEHERASVNLDTAEQYCHEIRDRMKPPVG